MVYCSKASHVFIYRMLHGLVYIHYPHVAVFKDYPRSSSMQRIKVGFVFLQIWVISTSESGEKFQVLVTQDLIRWYRRGGSRIVHNICSGDRDVV